jgi:tricorn protease interacting factor F2/3
MGEKRKTLGGNVIPIRYEIELEPDLSKFRFSGREEIEAYVKEPTYAIALNAAELAIRDAAVESGGAELKAAVSFDKEREQAVLRINSKVKGKVRISMRFSGTNNDKMYGFYRSKYLVGGKERYLLTTQFEPADARKAFPCFDEPALKAVFDVSIVADKGLECVSNMPMRDETTLANGKKRVSFLPTPKMSTYLVYLGVGNYDSVESSLGKVKMRVLTVEGKKDLAFLAMDYAKKAVRFYEDYFGIEYQLPKLDLLAIPDFAAGAMENWGAIAFRESDLLCNEGSSIAVKQRVADVIAHEIAHQWFGDLVTMKWWDDLWLNESFATFMSTKATEAAFPEWETGKQYLEDVIATAFAADQLQATHPINMEVNDPEEMTAIFDAISYDKGGTILNMIEDYVSPETFRAGLHGYLKEHRYGNATKHELWAAIDKAARKKGARVSVGKVASYWIDNPGYPVVDVKKEGKSYLLKQRRFFISKEARTSSRWPVPVHYATGPEGKDFRILMSGSTQRICAADDGGWIKLDFGQKGLYRVSYDEEMLEKLGKAIRGKELDSVDAWGLENDLFAFARSGRIPVGKYLDFAQKYCFGCGYPTDSTLLAHLGGLYAMLYSTKLSETARKPLVAYARSIIDRIGMERRRGEKSADTLLRSSAVFDLGIAGDEEMVGRTNKMFHEFVRGGREIDSNLRGAVYGIAAWTGGADTFDILEGRYRKEAVVEEKLRFLRALGLFKKRQLAERALSFALSKDVKYQDAISIPANVASNPLSRDLLLKWTKDNWKLLMRRYPPSTNMMHGFVSFLGVQKSEKAKKEIVSFFGSESNRRKDFEPELRRTLERIDTNIKFMRVNGV